MTKPIFVFGSNLQGRHGKGAALYAVQHHGAIYGQARGMQGNSYAIPTKANPQTRLILAAIESNVREFIGFATAHPEMTFQLTAIGCGLAGYKAADIAPMFKDAPSNVLRPPEWSEV